MKPTVPADSADLKVQNVGHPPHEPELPRDAESPLTPSLPMNPTPSPGPSPPLGERVPEGPVRGIRTGSGAHGAHEVREVLSSAGGEGAGRADGENNSAAAKKSRVFFWSLAGLLAAAAVLYFFPPEKYRLYPRCLFYSMTGLQCPGCGGLRAAHHLLHGHFVAALQLNPLAVLLLPVVAVLFAAHGLTRATGRDWIRPLRHPFWLWLLVGVAVAFSIARNLPYAPFTFFVY